MTRDHESDPGVPEAVARAVRSLVDAMGPHALDRLWIFPPRTRGRTERGLVVASRFDAERPEGRRRLFTARYAASRTGQGLECEVEVREEGEAPEGHLARVIDGVVRRSEDGDGEPREIEVRGDLGRLLSLAAELEVEGDAPLSGALAEPASEVETP